MGETGLVIEKEGSNIVVRMTRTEACARCRACKVGFASEEMLITAENVCSADIDDMVNIELENIDFLKAVMISYGIPLIMLIAGIAGGYAAGLFPSIFASGSCRFLLGIILMVLSYVWIHSREHLWKQKNFRPVATHIVDEVNQD